MTRVAMNCTEFESLVEQLADGELPAALRGEAESHAAACGACRAALAGVSAGSAAVRRACGDVAASEALRQRVRLAISAAAAGSARPGTVRRSLWWLAPAAAAALVMIVAIYRDPTPAAGPPVASTDHHAEADPVARVVTGLRVLHRQATLASATPLEPGPRPMPCGVEREMSRRMCQKVVAPDLSGHGVELVRADRCEVVGAVGVQVVYRCGTSHTTYSVFTLPRETPIGACDVATPTGRHYFVTCDENELSVVAWQDGDQTYALCAARPSEVLLAMADPLRSTCAPVPGEGGAMLCRSGGYFVSQEPPEPGADEGVLLAAAWP